MTRLGLKLGFDKGWIREAERGGHRLSDSERAVQALVIAVVARKGHDCRSELEAVIHSVGHAEAIAVLLLVGRYITHALTVNCLALEPPVASPLEEQ